MELQKNINTIIQKQKQSRSEKAREGREKEKSAI